MADKWIQKVLVTSGNGVAVRSSSVCICMFVFVPRFRFALYTVWLGRGVVRRLERRAVSRGVLQQLSVGAALRSPDAAAWGGGGYFQCVYTVCG